MSKSIIVTYDRGQEAINFNSGPLQFMDPECTGKIWFTVDPDSGQTFGEAVEEIMVGTGNADKVIDCELLEVTFSTCVYKITFVASTILQTV